MSDRPEALPYRRPSVPTIWVALALSSLIHLALLWAWPRQLHWLALESAERGNASGPLVVALARAPGAQEAVMAPVAPPVPTPRPRASRAARAAAPEPVRAPPVPAVIGLEPKPAPAIEPVPAVASAPAALTAAPAELPAPAPAPLPEAASLPAPIEGDLSSYIEARRRARGQAASDQMASPPPQAAAPRSAPAEAEAQRRNRVIAANLGLQQAPTVGYDPRAGGGIFEIRHISYAAAEFVFYGWNEEIRRNSKQLIEVERGADSDIRIAVVRRMIAIIRNAESGDFTWASQRLGRNVVLSARAADNAELEAFLMREFFGDPRPPR